MWVLILIIGVSTHHSGAAITTQEFTSQVHCVAAAQAFLSAWQDGGKQGDSIRPAKAVCVPK